MGFDSLSQEYFAFSSMISPGCVEIGDPLFNGVFHDFGRVCFVDWDIWIEAGHSTLGTQHWKAHRAKP
jgi:hypothetical protein